MSRRLRSLAGSVRVMAVLAGVSLALVARGAASEPAFPLTAKNPLLQTALQRELCAAGYGQVLERQELAVALVDLTQPGAPRFAGVNDDRMLYAASLPKVAILLGVAEAAERGDVEWDPSFAYRLRHMITRSDNADAQRGLAVRLRLRPRGACGQSSTQPASTASPTCWSRRRSAGPSSCAKRKRWPSCRERGSDRSEGAGRGVAAPLGYALLAPRIPGSFDVGPSTAPLAWVPGRIAAWRDA